MGHFPFHLKQPATFTTVGWEETGDIDTVRQLREKCPLQRFARETPEGSLNLAVERTVLSLFKECVAVVLAVDVPLACCV